MPGDQPTDSLNLRDLRGFGRCTVSEPRTIMEVLTVLAAAYPRFQLPAATVRIYEQTLSDIPLQTLRAATLDLIAESKFFPTVAELRKRAFALIAEQDGTADAYSAWALTLRFLRQGRGNPIIGRSKDWDIPPLIEQTVRQVGGWAYLAQADNVAADRARFIDAYDRTIEKQEYLTRRLPQIADLADRLSLPVAREVTVTEEAE